MEEGSRLLQIMLQSSFCILSSGLKSVAKLLRLKLEFKYLLNFRIDRCRYWFYEVLLAEVVRTFHIEWRSRSDGSRRFLGTYLTNCWPLHFTL